MSRAPVSAWWKAQELLARRAHGSQELINKLKLRDYPLAEIDAAVQRLFAIKALDDDAYARALTAELFTRRGYGYHVIIMRLRRKGLAKDLSENVVNRFFSELDEQEIESAIVRLIERRRAQEKDKNRLFAWLKRRGFRSDEIRLALQNFKKEREFNDRE